MSDSFTEVSSTGFLSNLGSSCVGVLVGIVLFLASFPLLWWNEGRPNKAEIARLSVVAVADKIDAGLEQKFISVTGKLESSESIGDPEFLKAGPWISLERKVEMFAWVEHEKTEEIRETGGSKRKETTYTYNTEWEDASSVKTSGFRYQAGHDNPKPAMFAERFTVKEATIGAYAFDAPNAEIPDGSGLTISENMLTSESPTLAAALVGRARKLEGNYIFSGAGSLSSPSLGDHRISWKALGRGLGVTMFAKQVSSRLQPYIHEGKTEMFRALTGGRDEAIATLAFEHAVLTWILRAVGFLLMWIGLSAVLGPISAVMDVIPALGSASRFLIGVVLFPIALGLTVVTIIVAKIFQSLLVTLLVGALILALVLGFAATRKKKVPSA